MTNACICFTMLSNCPQMTFELLAVDPPLTLMFICLTVWATMWVCSRQDGLKYNFPGHFFVEFAYSLDQL